jgi:dTDP-4-amino-4,6-dideoxygalactose transaminase
MADSVKENVMETLYSGYIGEGPKVLEFEEKLSRILLNPNVCAVNSATSGLHLAMHMLPKGTGSDGDAIDEVLTTPLTCVATNTPIVLNGLTLKFVDVDPNTCNMDLVDLRRKVSHKTLAVVVTHWGGQPVDLDEIDSINQDLCRSCGHSFKVIEDCAHAFGSTYKGHPIGHARTHHTCVFSFGPIKHLTCGDGGLVTFSNDEDCQRAKLLRWYGIDRSIPSTQSIRRRILEAGYKFHMNDVAASIGLGNLSVVKDNIDRGRTIAARLRKELRGGAALGMLEQDENSSSSCWLFTVLVERRADFIRKMRGYGIESHLVHHRNDMNPCFWKYKTLLPGMDVLEDTMTCIPCGWWLSDDDVSYMIECIKAGW